MTDSTTEQLSPAATLANEPASLTSEVVGTYQPKRAEGPAGRAEAAKAFLAALDDERAALLVELRSASGLGGRTRRLGDDVERARKAVSGRIRDAIGRLGETHPALSAHLSEHVTTGRVCRYR